MMHCEKGNRDFSFSRSVVNCALAVYIENNMSVKNPVQCLDLSTNGELSSKWMDLHGSSVIVTGPATKTNQNHHVTPESRSESSYTIVERTDFNFIYVECTTEGSSYFDCVFRKIARDGIFAISTSDDPALYGRPAEPALRCYSGRIIRTFYAPEMAVRLILAAMARSAGRFSKRIEVLVAIAIKNSITILVKVKKGAESAVKCLKEVKTLAHCSVCEERAFLNDNDGYIIDDVRSYLSCDCAKHNVGRTIQALGPLWSGAIGSASFVTSLLLQDHLALQLTSFLQDLVTELRCDSHAAKREILLKKDKHCVIEEADEMKESSDISISLVDNPLKRRIELDQCEFKKKIKRVEDTDLEPAPSFYYNIHKHKPKGTQKLVKVDKAIEILHQLSFRASRTHFDRAAVKTNATLLELQSVLSKFT